MPTFTIQSEALAPRAMRHIAVAVTRWCRDRGIDPTHVNFLGDQREPGLVVTGGVPRRDAAVVNIELSPDRSHEFVTELVGEVAAQLHSHLASSWVLIRVSPRSTFDTFVYAAAESSESIPPAQPPGIERQSID